MKKIYLLYIAVFTNILSVTAQSTGYQTPSVYTSSGNGVPWGNLSGVLAVDNNPAYVDLAQYPTCTPNICYYSNVAKFTGFGFNVPSGATITGIELQILQRVSSPGGGIHDSTLYLTYGGVSQGINKAFPANWLDTPTYHLYGSMTDDWGYPWTPAEVNDSSFGLLYQITDTSYDQPGSVDQLQMNVYYQTGTGIHSLSSNSINIYLIDKIIFANGLLSNLGNHYQLEIDNILGKRIYKETITPINNDIRFEKDFSLLESGIYIALLISESGIVSRKIVFFN